MNKLESTGPLVGADHIQDNFDLVPQSKLNVWVLPGILALLVLVIGAWVVV